MPRRRRKRWIEPAEPPPFKAPEPDELVAPRQRLQDLKAERQRLLTFEAKPPGSSKDFVLAAFNIAASVGVIGGLGATFLASCGAHKNFSSNFLGWFALLAIGLLWYVWTMERESRRTSPARCEHGVFLGKRWKRCAHCIRSYAERLETLVTEIELAELALNQATSTYNRRVMDLRSDHARMVAYERRLREATDDYHQSTLDGLRAMHPGDFERTVARAYSALGWTVEVVGGVGDGGVDILAHKAGHVLAIQCKRYGHGSSVGAPEVQAFFGAIQCADANAGVIVTTGTFTSAARAAAEKLDVTLIDAESLREMLGLAS